MFLLQSLPESQAWIVSCQDIREKGRKQELEAIKDQCGLIHKVLRIGPTTCTSSREAKRCCDKGQAWRQKSWVLVLMLTLILPWGVGQITFSLMECKGIGGFQTVHWQSQSPTTGRRWGKEKGPGDREVVAQVVSARTALLFCILSIGVPKEICFGKGFYCLDRFGTILSGWCSLGSHVGKFMGKS